MFLAASTPKDVLRYRRERRDLKSGSIVSFYEGRTLKQLFNQHEGEQKRKYNQRIIDIEMGTFTPLVFSTIGGIAPECNRFLKEVGNKTS